jgi:Tol biopolymer transport system component
VQAPSLLTTRFYGQSVNRFATRALLAALGLAALVGLVPASAANGTAKIMFVGCSASGCAYGRDEGIYVMNPDGSELTRLATGVDASWSPDGTRLAFVRTARKGGKDLYLVKADGSGELQLTTGLSTWEQALSAGWSPDGTQLAVQRSGSRPFATFLVSAQGGPAVKLAEDAVGATWSSDGSRLAYLRSPQSDEGELIVANADGTGTHRIPLPWPVTSVDTAVWSPEGDRIAFVDRRTRRLYAINADGNGPLKLADHVVLGGPVWSPAGDRLAFVAEGSGVHAVNADGSGLVRLGDFPTKYASVSDLAWSPDGTRVAYAAGGPVSCWRCGDIPVRGWEIYAVNSDGTHATTLTTNGIRLVSDTAPVWSPDGTKIVFASTRAQRLSSNGEDLFQMNSDGSCETRLTSGLLIRSTAAWQPLPGTPVSTPYRCVDLRLDLPYPDVDPGGGYLDRDRVYVYAPVVTNDGNLPATGVQLRYVVPDRMVLISAQPTQGSCSGSPELVCSLGIVDPGGTATVVLRFRVPEPARLGNVMSVSGNEPDNDPSYDHSDPWQWDFPWCRVIDGPGAVVHGTSDDDLICGTTHGDRINSATGDDELRSGPGNDRLDAGPGSDIVYAEEDQDEIWGGDGRDRIFSQEGDDVVRGGDGDDWAFAETGADILDGGGGADKLLGGSGRDRIEGGSGDDSLHGGEGSDWIEGGAGDDVIGHGTNVFHDGYGDDVVYAGAGDDVVKDRHGRDRLYGGPGNDTFHAKDRHSDRIVCGPGRDVAFVDRRDRVHRSCERVVYARSR